MQGRSRDIHVTDRYTELLALFDNAVTHLSIYMVHPPPSHFIVEIGRTSVCAIKINEHLPAPTLNVGGDSFWTFRIVETSVTLTLTLNLGHGHTIVNHSSTSTHTLSFIHIRRKICGRTDGNRASLYQVISEKLPKNGMFWDISPEYVDSKSILEHRPLSRLKSLHRSLIKL